VIVPDLLGYGDTDKPSEPEQYKFKKMAGHLIEILEKEGVEKVVGVGHDWGSRMLSRLWNYYPERLTELVFVSVPYMEPGVFNLDALNAASEKLYGYPTFGFWKFFNEDDAVEICDRNHESLSSLMYPTTPDVWMKDLTPLGASRAWVTSSTIAPRPTWLSASETATHNQIFSKGGHEGPFNWYKACIRNVEADDDALIPEERRIVTVPTLLVTSDKDYVTRAETSEKLAPIRLKSFWIEKVIDAGHWIQLEKKNELNMLLLGFLEGVSGV